MIRRQHRGRGSTQRRIALGVVLVVVIAVVVALVFAAAFGSGPGPSRDIGPGAEPSASVVTPTAAPRVGRADPERPTQMRLPSGTAVPLVSVGTTPTGLLDVPMDVRTAGWWRAGARVGDAFGSILVAGHVDSRTQGLGAYAELLGLDGGEPVSIRSAHLRQDFRVQSLRLIDRDSVPQHAGLWSSAGRLRLTLVTCAPPYLPEQGGYQRLAVVTAVPTAPPATS